MLEISFDNKTDSDQLEREDDDIYCAACSTVITQDRHRVERNEVHEHTVFNPAGKIFTIQCFKEAQNIAVTQDASSEFSWFRGYEWRICGCAQCQTHLGWRFEGPDIFYAFIKSALSDSKNS